jgi:hypothetical protein
MNGQDPGWWVTFRHELPREDSLPAGDRAGFERHILELEATRYRYYVTRPGEPEREDYEGGGNAGPHPLWQHDEVHGTAGGTP